MHNSNRSMHSTTPNYVIVVDDEDENDIPSSWESEVEFVLQANVASSETDLSDIVVVSEQRRNKPISLPLCTPESVTNDVSVVGELKTIDATFYSHFRYMCSQPKPCHKCFCFVCDVPQRQCKTWFMHKLAIDNSLWRKMRQEAQDRRTVASSTHSQTTHAFGNDCTNYHDHSGRRLKN